MVAGGNTETVRELANSLGVDNFGGKVDMEVAKGNLACAKIRISLLKYIQDRRIRITIGKTWAISQMTWAAALARIPGSQEKQPNAAWHRETAGNAKRARVFKLDHNVTIMMDSRAVKALAGMQDADMDKGILERTVPRPQIMKERGWVLGGYNATMRHDDSSTSLSLCFETPAKWITRLRCVMNWEAIDSAAKNQHRWSRAVAVEILLDYNIQLATGLACEGIPEAKRYERW